MTKLAQHAAPHQDIRPRSALAVLKDSREFLKLLSQLLTSSEAGQRVVSFCRQHRTYLPLSPEFTTGSSFSDGHSAASPRVQVIAATERGLMVLSSYPGPRVPGDCLAYPFLGQLPGFRSLQVLMALTPARAAGFDLGTAQKQLEELSKGIQAGESPKELRLMVPGKAEE